MEAHPHETQRDAPASDSQENDGAAGGDTQIDGLGQMLASIGRLAAHTQNTNPQTNPQTDKQLVRTRETQHHAPAVQADFPAMQVANAGASDEQIDELGDMLALRHEERRPAHRPAFGGEAGRTAAQAAFAKIKWRETPVGSQHQHSASYDPKKVSPTTASLAASNHSQSMVVSRPEASSSAEVTRRA